MNNEHFFGEWVEYRDEKEKEEARCYLLLWKKFFMRKISEMEFIGEFFVDQPKCEIIKKPANTLGLKLHMRGKNPEDMINSQDLSIH